MASVIGSGVSLRSIYIEDWQLTFNISGTVSTSDVGKAVSLDTTTSNTVKLAADGDYIIGRLETVEVRTNEGITVGTVALKGSYSFPKASGTTIAIGSTLVGAGSGLVKAGTVTDAVGVRNLAVEVPTTTSVVAILL